MTRQLNIAVIGTGISGLAAAWLLSTAHRVTVYESDARPGGHANTVDVPIGRDLLPVDTGFIVYNEPNYPNLSALFRHLGVPTRPSEMSFAVSLDRGRVEYAGTNLVGIFAQKRNLLRPSFWAMLRDILRFFNEAPALLADRDREDLTLGQLLDEGGYSRAFVEDHLLPMAAAIWSAPTEIMRAHSAVAFVRFCDNHGLLRLRDRPLWRCVIGGSREYVRHLTASFADRLRLNCAARAIHRSAQGVVIADQRGALEHFDHVVIAAHADQALDSLENPTASEEAVLGAFRYQGNFAVLHRDDALMPKRRSAWASWNYLGLRGIDGTRHLCATYWLNRLQSLPGSFPLFLTLNPIEPPRQGSILRSFAYEHPIFDVAALRAQRDLWSLQGRANTWFCGAYFGSGFHEDGLQAGLAVAEALGGVRRPWTVANESGRIIRGPDPIPLARVALR